MAKPTHSLRPKGADKWEHVTDEQLATIKAQVGERTFRTHYEVKPIAEKPDALPTTTSTPASASDEAPVTPQSKEKDKK